MAVYFNSAKETVNGKRNSSSPVALFIVVCRDRNVFWETYPKTILMILIIAMRLPQIHNHGGRWIAGKILTNDTVTNTRSAAVSSLAPRSLVLFVFLATVPSSMSLKPQKRYKI